VQIADGSGLWGRGPKEKDGAPSGNFAKSQRTLSIRSSPGQGPTHLSMNQSAALTKGLPSYISAGVVLGGKYRLERELGRGAMGMVWSAVHLTLGQRVAIKLISAEHAQSVEARE